MERLLTIGLMATMITATAMAQSADDDSFAGQKIVGEKQVTAAIVISEIPEELAVFEKAGLSKYASVFGVHVYGTADVPDEKFLHAAKITAQYVDNDSDGVPDNIWVLSNMISRHAGVVVTRTVSQLREIEGKLSGEPKYRYTLALGSGAVRPGFVNEDGSVNPEVGQDNSLEEIWHLFCDAGFGPAYPDIFGTRAGSAVAGCMDIARAGHFTEPPTDGPKKGYPEQAWYYYDDVSCTYSCMITEYIYWGMTSLLGVQEFNTANRPASGKGESGEWGAYTPELMQTLDPCLTDLLTDPKYKMPTKAPDGLYAPSAMPTVTVPVLEVDGE